MRTVHDIHGGIHPPERKQLSNPGVLGVLPLPPTLVVPVSQHIGRPAEVVVAVGDRVLGGQTLAQCDGPLSAAVHAPTSGIVAAIELRPVPHASGLEDLCVVIDVDGQDTWQALTGDADWRDREPRQLIDRIRDAGIAGLGGAGFPTAVKLIAGENRPIHTLLINGTECEPYITADDTLMQIASEAIIEGAQILAHIVAAEKVLIGVEDNKPQALANMQDAATERDWPVEVEVATFPTKYPSGGEKQLIEILTGQQVPSGGLPADIGIVCQAPGTAVAVRDAIIDGRPLVDRIVTLTGEALGKPQNVRALFGTPIEWLLAHAGFDPTDNERVIHGGPMMGFALRDTTAPMVKITNCVLAPTRSELPMPPPAQACIRCGMCAEACPASLLPQQLYWYARAKDQEQLEKHQLFDCIECGACSYVCPSHIPLVQYYRSAKGTIREARAEKMRSDNSRERFEARQLRVEKEAAEREAKRAARKAAAAKKAEAGGEDPVQAAIARAQARKAEQTTQDAGEDPIQAAIARAAARKAAKAKQANERAPDAGAAADQENPSSETDPS